MGLIRFGIAVLALGATATFVACSHNPPPPAGGPATGASSASGPPPSPCTTPEPLRIEMQASPRLNPGEKGEALATVVRVYQLKSAGKLQAASFDDMLDHDRDTLGDDFIAVNEVTINPGDRVTPPFARNADAAYVAGVALFRQPAGNTWRAIRRLPAPDPQHCHASATTDNTTRFALDENRIDLR